MKKILETERLYLREMQQSDYQDLCKILQDPEVMYAYEHAFSDEETQAWLDKQLQRYKEDGFGLWAVILKDTDEMIGQCGLSMQDCDGKQVPEVGYLFRKKFWHKGYATEAAVACKEYAFYTLNIDEVYTIIRDINIASQKVAERNGMKRRGRIIKHYYGIDMPHYYYSVKKDVCEEYPVKVIARIHSDFPSKFGIPHQSGRIPELKSEIVFEPPYRNREALRGIEEYTYIWLIWGFSENLREKWSPTVRPPRLGGNIRKGVFATRSPFRPNALGLSCVKLDKVEYCPKVGPVLHVLGADLMDQTPIFDIKPYLPYIESHPDAAGGFTDSIKDHRLFVEFPQELLQRIPEEKRSVLLEVLANDPRPGYQKDPGRAYGMPFGKQDVHFRVENSRLIVFDVTDYQKED